MAFSNAWDETSPPGPQAVGLGDDRIREFKLDIRQRLGSILDLTGTRDFTSTTFDPQEIKPGHVDTAALDPGAGSPSAVDRAVTYFQSAEIVANSLLAGTTTAWQTGTNPLTITVPGTLLKGSGIEHTSGTAISTNDYQIEIRAEFQCRISGVNADARLYFRIRNTTNSSTVSIGDNQPTGNPAQAGLRSLAQIDGFGSAESYQWIVLSGRDTLRSIATSYALEMASSTAVGGGAAGIYANGNALGFGPARLYVNVFKR